MDIVIEAVDLHKVYHLGKIEIHALRGVSMKVYRNELLCIMGPSGSGKTTLLNIIGTLDKPTRGKVFLDGVEITSLSEKELTKIRRNKIGFIFQFHNLIPVLTALENVELPMILAGVPREERIKRVKFLLKLVGLEDRMNHRPHELSGGEQQRVAIARALANNPSIILADEPTGELDTENSEKVMKIFKDVIKEEGATAIVVTHNLLLKKYADRILHLRDGRIVKEEKL
ncbi:MAG: ABC transporter ATP-binding protein [Candidatus Njordarchaeales archaeon]